MRDSPSVSSLFEVCFWEISDFMILAAFSVSSSEKRAEAMSRFLASSMFFTVMPVA